jgi:hypothetical protein
MDAVADSPGPFFIATAAIASCVGNCTRHGRVPDYGDVKRCYQCDGSCAPLQCAGSTAADCTACPADWYPKGSLAAGDLTCHTEAACNAIAGYFSDDDSVSCSPCHATCSSCVGSLSTECSACAAATPLRAASGASFSCVAACEANEYPSVEGVCTACAGSCETCNGASDGSCETCYAGSGSPYLQKLNGAAQGTCVATCGAGFETDAPLLACFQCHDHCDSCTGAASTQCTTCAAAFPYLLAQECVADCGVGYFVGAGEQCQPCHPDCTTCDQSGASNCLTCGAGEALEEAAPSQCVLSCDTDQYVTGADSCAPCDNTCSTCAAAGASACLGCPAGRLLKQAAAGGAVGECVADCGVGYFADSASTCAQCEAKCGTCVGGAGLCASCADSAHYLAPPAAGGGCFASCATDGHASHPYSDAVSKTCMASCEDTKALATGAYVSFTDASDATKSCRACHSSCGACSGGEAAACTACGAAGGGLFLTAAGTCEASCGLGFFNSSATTCAACSAECSACAGASDRCLACADSAFYLAPASAAGGSGCFAACNVGRASHPYSDPLARACLPTATACAATAAPTYADGSFVCQPCDVSCASCGGPAVCTACKGTYFSTAAAPTRCASCSTYGQSCSVCDGGSCDAIFGTCTVDGVVVYCPAGTACGLCAAWAPVARRLTPSEGFSFSAAPLPSPPHRRLLAFKGSADSSSTRLPPPAAAASLASMTVEAAGARALSPAHERLQDGALQTLRRLAGEVAVCPAATYAIAGDGNFSLCRACFGYDFAQPAQSRCHACTGPLPSNCSACSAGWHRSNSTAAGRCVRAADCAVGTFALAGASADLTGGTCVAACPAGAYGCSGCGAGGASVCATDCNGSPAPTLRYRSASAVGGAGGVCVASCPVDLPMQMPMAGGDACLAACLASHPKNDSNTCVAACPELEDAFSAALCVTRAFCNGSALASGSSPNALPGVEANRTTAGASPYCKPQFACPGPCHWGQCNRNSGSCECPTVPAMQAVLLPGALLLDAATCDCDAALTCSGHGECITPTVAGGIAPCSCTEAYGGRDCSSKISKTFQKEEWQVTAVALAYGIEGIDSAAKSTVYLDGMANYADGWSMADPRAQVGESQTALQHTLQLHCNTLSTCTATH